jgi:hypothetical protein
MEEEPIIYIETPWDCDTLDPFRDDPKGDSIVIKSSEDPAAFPSTDTMERPKCSCGENCPTMPTVIEQVCCKDVKTWQTEHKGDGEFVSHSWL